MACGGGAAQGGGDAPADAREVLLSACSTQQGIGYLKREYGERMLADLGALFSQLLHLLLYKELRRLL